MIDSHCHIDFDEFGTDRDAVLQRALAAGVERLIIPSVHPQYWARVVEYASYCREHGVIADYAIGLHPWWADAFPLAELPAALYAALEGAVAVGECGLDALRDTPMSLQCEVLQCHIEAAIAHELPLILHCVKAHDTLLHLLKAAQPVAGGVIHGFAGSIDIAQQYIALGFSIGVGGMVTRPHASRAQRAFKDLPLSALLLETDAPAMPLWSESDQQLEGRNEPANIARIATALSVLRDCDVNDVIAACQNNTQRLFRRMR
ncbi:MAG TPA: TatD family hydrolase [Pseudomonadales bacterium]|nr:TatD family hydrolase [Pseudomonadales bacterium]